jgi:hypothetical protein
MTERSRDHALGDIKPPKVADNLLVLLQERAANLRQLFLRAHRGLNDQIAAKLVKRGYVGIRSEHVTVLGNMSLGETSFGELASRAQTTIEGIKQIVENLRDLGYLHVDYGLGYLDTDYGSVLGASNGIANFTDAGWELMLTSFNVLREIETEYQKKLQKGDIEQLRRILGVLFD